MACFNDTQSYGPRQKPFRLLLQCKVPPMDHFESKATRIDVRDFSSAAMRAFHVSWFAFFTCFFAWFGIALLLKWCAARCTSPMSRSVNASLIRLP